MLTGAVFTKAEPGTKGDETTFLPGDSVYFANHPDYGGLEGATDWSGENAVYVGAGLYAGHGMPGLHTGAEIRESLMGAYNDLVPAEQAISLVDLPGPVFMYGPPNPNIGPR